MRIRNEEDVLLVIDMQNDHVSGTLAHPGAPSLIERINRLAEAFEHIIVVKDWHPPGHVSFRSSHEEVSPQGTVETHYGPQMVHAEHCVQGTEGAEYPTGFRLERAELEFRKGYRPDADSYGAFHMNDATPTGLAELLRVRGYKRVFGVGVGKYGCVGWTLKGAVREGFESFIVEDCCKQHWGARAKNADDARRLDELAARDLVDIGVRSVDSEAIIAASPKVASA